jgi:hypothetical protein
MKNKMKRAMRETLTQRGMIIMVSSADGIPFGHLATAIALMSFCEPIKNNL